MAAVLCRRGAQLCCVHRELYKVVWRPQTVCFSSKPTEKNPPRRTHIKKAKPQPPVDVNTLVEKLFSLTRSDVAPSKARLARGIQKPPPASSVTPSNIPPVAFSPASRVKEDHNDALSSSFTAVQPTPQPKAASPANPEPLDSHAQAPPADEGQTFSITTETKTDTASESSSFPAASVEILTITTIESPLESRLPAGNAPVSSASVVEGPVEPSVDISINNTLTSGANSEVIHLATTVDSVVKSPIESSIAPEESLPAGLTVFEGPVKPNKIESINSALGTFGILEGEAEELSIKPQLESPVEFSLPLVEPLQSPVESSIDVTIDNTPQEQSADTVVNASLAAGVKYSTQTTVESPVESWGEPLEAEALITKSQVECTIDVTIENAHQEVLAKGIDRNDPGVHAAGIEYSTESTIESGVEANLSSMETLPEGAGEVTVDNTPVPTISTPFAIEEHQIETTIEQADSFFNGTVESIIKDKEADDILLMDSFQNAQKLVSSPLGNATEEASGGFAILKEAEKEPEKMTLESMTLYSVTVSVESFKTDEFLRTKSELDEKAALVQATEDGGTTEGKTDTLDDGETLTDVLAKWASLSEDLEGLEGESGALVNELLCSVPTAVPQTPVPLKTSTDLPEAAQGDSTPGEEVAAMTLESVTLEEVMGEVERLETKVLHETCEFLEKEAEELVKEEKMQVETTGEDVEYFQDMTGAGLLTMDSIDEATDAIEAETSVMMEAMFGSEQGPRQTTGALLKEPQPRNDGMGQEEESDQDGADVLEAMSLESVTLAEVEASLGTLEFVSETADYLEKEAQVLVGEKKMDIEDEVVIEETTEGVTVEPLSLPEGEDLETDALMEELLFTIPGQTAVVRDDRIVQESPDIQTDVDPVQKLFLQKIREYHQKYRSNGERIRHDPHLHNRLAEETDKLQKVFGGGDLTSFPRFHFPEPELDQDSK